MSYFVYILKSESDQDYYVGCTGNLEDRLQRHFEGRSSATKHRLPLVLMAYREFEDKAKAFETEREFKRKRYKKFIEEAIVEWSGEVLDRAPRL